MGLVDQDRTTQSRETVSKVTELEIRIKALEDAIVLLTGITDNTLYVANSSGGSPTVLLTITNGRITKKT